MTETARLTRPPLHFQCCGSTPICNPREINVAAVAAASECALEVVAVQHWADLALLAELREEIEH